MVCIQISGVNPLICHMYDAIVSLLLYFHADLMQIEFSFIKNTLPPEGEDISSLKCFLVLCNLSKHDYTLVHQNIMHSKTSVISTFPNLIFYI